MSIAKNIVLHNAAFYKSSFRNLKLNLIEYEQNNQNGYKHEIGKLLIPMLGPSPDNAYSSESNGTFELTAGFMVFDEKLLFEHKQYYINSDIKFASIYEKYHNPISNVDFINSKICDSENISFHRCNFESYVTDSNNNFHQSTVINNVSIYKIKYCNFQNVIFVNCKFQHGFNKCKINNCIFINCNFVEDDYKSKFYDNTFYGCNINDKKIRLNNDIIN